MAERAAGHSSIIVRVGEVIIPLLSRQTVFLIPVLLQGMLLLPVPADAGISGSVELNYSHNESTLTDSSGVSTDTTIEGFRQTYRLNLEQLIYPNLKFTAGGIFEKDKTTTTEDSLERESTTTKVIPMTDLTLNTPLISAGIGFQKKEEKFTSGDTPSITEVRDNYSARLGWRPEGLPRLDSLYQRIYTYDKDRIFEDRVSDSAVLGLAYDPIKNLELRYQGTYNDTTDRLADINIKQISHNAAVRYSREFFNRVALSTSYNFTRSETTTVAKGQGEVTFQQFTFAGLSAISNTPASVTLDPSPGLIDTDVTAITGINIGPVPIGGDDRLRNIGLDFFNITEVNTLYLWVDRELPAAAVATFVWDVYVSSDNLNWTLLQPNASATFDTFLPRFEIRIPNVSVRYIKVVTRPLPRSFLPPPGIDVSNIFVTELQAFLTQQAADVEREHVNTTHLYELNAKTRIFDRPYIYHDLYYWYSKTDPGTSRYILSNAVSLSHRLSRVFSTLARVAREDSKELTGDKVAYVYSASLAATPLRTLYHNLLVSGRHETLNERSNDQQSVFLNNSAELYKGISVSLNGGLSWQKSETGRKTDSTLLNAGVSLVPRSNLTIGFGVNNTTTDQTGGGLPDTSLYTRNWNATLSYTPFNALYIFASVGMSSEKDREDMTTQQYAISWSPLAGGSLQVAVTYSVDLNSANDGKITTFTPSLRWNITPRAYLDVSYQDLEDSSVSQTIDTQVFSATFRSAF